MIRFEGNLKLYLDTYQRVEQTEYPVLSWNGKYDIIRSKEQGKDAMERTTIRTGLTQEQMEQHFSYQSSPRPYIQRPYQKEYRREYDDKEKRYRKAY